MKRYNKNNNKIELVPSLINIDGLNKYSKKLTNEELVSAGYYKVVYNQKPNKRYYVSNEKGEIIDDIYQISYEEIPRDIESLKLQMLKDLSVSYKKFMERPIVQTSLGYPVDGGRNDVFNFEDGKAFGLTQIKDANGVFQEVSSDDYDTIIAEIKANGLAMFDEKWKREEEIKSFESIDDCILFEHSPYEVQKLIVDDNGDPILDDDGNEQYETVTKYKNKTTQL